MTQTNPVGRPAARAEPQGASMTYARELDPRTFIRVHDDIENHPKIAALSDKAFRLLITSWGLSSRHGTDGFMKDAVWRKRGTPRARAELLMAGLVHEPGHTCRRCPPVPAGQVKFHDFLDHQRSAEERANHSDKKREDGLRGNHVRWHVARGITDPDCRFCADDKPAVGTSQKRSPDDRKRDRPSDRKPDRTTVAEEEEEKELRDLAGNAGVGHRASDDRDVLGDAPHTPTAHRLVEAYAASCRRRPPRTVLTDLARRVDALLREDWPPDEISRALTELGARGKHAKLLPAIAHELVNRITQPRPGEPRPSTTDMRTAAVQALKQDFQHPVRQAAARLELAAGAPR